MKQLKYLVSHLSGKDCLSLVSPEILAYSIKRQCVTPCANWRNIVGQQLPALLGVTCRIRRYTLSFVSACCCVLLGIVAQSQKSQTFESTNRNSLFCDHRSVAQQYWSRLDSSSNIVEPRTCITHGLQSYGLYPSHDALQVPTFLGVVVFVCMLLKKIGRQRTLRTGVSFSVIFSFNYFELAAIKVSLLANGPRRIHSENKILFAFLTHFIRVIAMNISIPSRSHRCHDPINRCTVTGEGGRVQQTCSKETAKPMKQMRNMALLKQLWCSFE